MSNSNTLKKLGIETTKTQESKLTSTSSISSTSTSVSSSDTNHIAGSGIPLQRSTSLPNSDTSTSSPDSTSALSSSFASLVEKHKKPYIHSYNNFATSYICSDIPCPRLFGDDSDSTVSVVSAPFSKPVFLEQFSIQEKLRKELGQSIRKGKLIPSTQIILDQIHHIKFPTQEERTAFLYAKAKQWCEVNKALSVDERYPKPDPNVVRRKYSLEHQRAMQLARNQIGLKKNAPLFHRETKAVATFPKPIELRAGGQKKQIVEVQTEAQVMAAAATAEKAKLDESVEEIFKEIKPLPELQDRAEPWQFKAEKSLTTVPKPKKKSFFRKNIYPPKTKEQVIAEMRKKLPPLKPDYLQTDYLSGIWEPELMTDEFRITPLDFDSRLEKDEGPDPVDWWEIQKSKEKCSRWLKSIPDSL